MRQLRLFFLLAIALGAIAGSARAQCPEDARLRTLRDLETTDARIEQAIQAVSESGSEPARLELRAAQDIQANARAEFNAGHCRIASDITRHALFRASRAIEIVRAGEGPPPPGGGPDPGRVLDQLERTRNLLERARDRIEECNDDRARAMLQAAFEMQRRAEEAFAQQRGLAALQLTVGARDRAWRALRLCKMGDNLKESAARALRRTDELLARARDRLATQGEERTRKVLRRAIELQERATREFHAGHFEASLRLTQTARTLSERSIRMAGAAS